MKIPLRAKDGSVRAYALVDDEDFEWLSRWRWLGYCNSRQEALDRIAEARRATT